MRVPGQSSCPSMGYLPSSRETQVLRLPLSQPKYTKLKAAPLSTLSTKTLRGPSNDPLKVKDRFIAILGKGSLEVEQELFIIVGLLKQLVGCPAIQAVELAVRVLGVQECKSNPVARYPNIFKGLGNLETITPSN